MNNVFPVSSYRNIYTIRKLPTNFKVSTFGHRRHRIKDKSRYQFANELPIYTKYEYFDRYSLYLPTM